MYLGVNAVIKCGKRIGQAQETQPSTPAGNRLIAIINNGLWQLAPDVSSPGDYNELYRAYSAGAYLDMILYLLPESEVEQCPNEGRVPIKK